jgi:LacI family transcriptional regulator
MEEGSAFTMADVARLAGVSVSTVSNVLNNKAVVSPELTARVQQAIKAIGFSPNRAARGLRRGRTEIIGMVIPDVTNPFYAQVVRGVEDTAIKNGYELMVCNSNRQPDLERRHLDALQAQRVDGILLVPSNTYAAREVLVRNYPPIVFVDCFPLDSKVNCVVTDNIGASYEAVRYLIGLGHRKIAVITAELTYTTMIDRMEGYRKAMQEAGIPIRLEYTAKSATEIEGGYRSGLNLFRLTEPPTAIFSLNNRMTLGILQALRELGIPCPERVSIMSFDDPDWATVFSPTLTAIEQPSYQIGISSVQLLLKSIRSAASKTANETQRVEIKSKLLIRESTGPVPKI